MNAKKSLKKYVGPSGGVKLLAWLLALATLALLGVGIQQSSIEDDPNEAVPFNPIEAKSGDYVYLDIVGVSNWLYKVESDSSSTVYYSAEDAQDYWYTVILSGSQYGEMLTQRTYWNREYGENDPNAEVYRVYGTAKSTSREVKQALTDSWYDMGITSVSMYEEYFGTMHLDATDQPSDGRGMGYIVGAIFAFAGWISAALANGKSKKAMKQSVKRLEALGELDKAAEELSGSVTVIGKDKCRISENYIYTKRGGVAIPIKDILWTYKHITRTNGINGNTQLMADTCTGKCYSLISTAGNDRKGKCDEIAAAIIKGNPTVLVGYNSDNMAEYRALLKEYKTTGVRPADKVAAVTAEPADAAAAVTATATATAAATVAEAAAPTAEPVVEAAEAVAETAEPVVEAAEAVAETAEPVVESAEAVVETAEPVVEAAEAVVETAEPVVEAAEAVVETAEPVVEAAEAVAEVKTEE